MLDPTHVREYRSAEAANAPLRAAGLEVAVEADVATMSGLVEAICDHYAVVTG